MVFSAYPFQHLQQYLMASTNIGLPQRKIKKTQEPELEMIIKEAFIFSSMSTKAETL
jgi:hypothetical protein